MNAKVLPTFDPKFDGFSYEFSVNYLGQTLTLISTRKGAKVEDVLAFAEAAHGEKYLRVCDEVRLAKKAERPERWDVNPMPCLQGEIWMVVVVWRLYTFFESVKDGSDE